MCTCENLLWIATISAFSLKAVTQVYNWSLFLVITYLAALLFSVLPALYVTCSKLYIMSHFARSKGNLPG